MGNYINKLPDGHELDAYGKAHAIARLPNVRELMEPPKRLDEVPDGFILVAVVVSHPWEAALICDTQGEIDVINFPDRRPTRYFYVARDDARKMADFPLESERLPAK